FCINIAMRSKPYVISHTVELSKGDTVSVWSWTGAYKDGGAREKETNDQIALLKEKLGTENYPKYETLVGIAGQYELLGDGRSAYSYFKQAIDLDPTKSLAYFNLAHLFEQLGALNSARDMYIKAVEIEPGNTAYAQARAVFMKERFPNQP
ncbi:MAG: tetratricopeptide repeat protein, partial [Patescibacteria group bacterium]